jgi:hypothetical protein
VPLEADGTPPRAAVRDLSDEIETAMREVMLHAEQEEALWIIDRAERIFSAEEVDAADEEQRLARSLQLRQRFLAGYSYFRARAPQRLAAVESRISRFEQELQQAGIDPSDLSLPPTAGHTIMHVLAQVLSCCLLFPLAVVGSVIHYPAYRLVGYLARQLGQEADVLSTFKIISAMLFFPLTWIALAVLAWGIGGWLGALATLLIAPLCGYAAVRFFEEFDRFFGSFIALAIFVMKRRLFVRLLAERAAIKRDIVALGEDWMMRSS